MNVLKIGFWQIWQFNSRGQETVCCSTWDEVIHYFTHMVYPSNKVKIRWIMPYD